MKPEQLACSLALAKRLEELGVFIPSRFQWCTIYHGKEETATLVENENYETKGTAEDGKSAGQYLTWAPTAEEIADILPVILDDEETLKKNGGALFLNMTKPYECGTDSEYTKEEADLFFGKYIVGYSSDRPESTEAVSRGGDTLANALAKLVILLKETGRFIHPIP
jgi:hypothetical protein